MSTVAFCPKPWPLIVSGCCGLPASTLVGLMELISTDVIVNCTAFEREGEPGVYVEPALFTVMVGVPLLCKSVNGIVTLSCVLLTKTVASPVGVLLQLLHQKALEPVTKFVPVTTAITLTDPPAVVPGGVMLVIDGEEIGKASALDCGPA